MHASQVILISIVTSVVTATSTAYLLERLELVDGKEQSAKVAVPDVRGLSEKDARTNLTTAGLVAVIGPEEPSDEVPAKHVAGQTPLAGQSVKNGGVVTLTLAAPLPQVPDLLGKTKDDATSVLRQAGYQVEFGDPVPHASIEKDAVVRQVPAAAEPAKSGSAVVLHLSSGPEQVSVPSLTGLNVASAKQKLEELGLKLGNVRWVYDEDLYPNAIVSQDPRPNAKLGAGTGVDIAVNRE